MEVNKHIGFRAEDEAELIEYLNKHNLRWKRGKIVSTLDIYESNTNWPWILEYTEKKGLFLSSEMVFSKDELKNAQWLRLRSKWRFGYPQPENAFGYESLTYTKDNHCDVCGVGLRQVDSFRIKKVPIWGKKSFLMLNWIGDELFLNEKAKLVLEGASISGVDFLAVKNCRGNKSLPDIYQLVILNKMKNGLIEGQSGIDQISICPHCGIKKYHPTGTGMLTYRKEVFENMPEIIKTAEEFGWGRGSHRNILISQRIYQLILEHDLAYDLVFEPLELL